MTGPLCTFLTSVSSAVGQSFSQVSHWSQKPGGQLAGTNRLAHSSPPLTITLSLPLKFSKCHLYSRISATLLGKKKKKKDMQSIAHSVPLMTEQDFLERLNSSSSVGET